MSECEALTSLYNSTNGAGWMRTGWGTTAQPCSWFGVRCSDGHVVTLDLLNNRLNGSLPAALGALSNLRLLDLRWNQLSGSLPPALGNLSSLEDLYLSSNQLSGNIPPDLGRLGNLQSIYLDDNHFGGNIPPALGDSSKLKTLNLSHNQLHGEAPAALCNLSDLRHPLFGLSLAYNALAGGPACSSRYWIRPGPARRRSRRQAFR